MGHDGPDVCEIPISGASRESGGVGNGEATASESAVSLSSAVYVLIPPSIRMVPGHKKLLRAYSTRQSQFPIPTSNSRSRSGCLARRMDTCRDLRQLAWGTGRRMGQRMDITKAMTCRILVDALGKQQQMDEVLLIFGIHFTYLWPSSFPSFQASNPPKGLWF
jgi:hypothetical protein